MKKMQKAFSLIEIIFVLIILGIVGSISSQIIVQVYESYIIQNALYKVNINTELTAKAIVNRLAYRIQGTTISKDISKTGYTENVDWKKLRDVMQNDKFTTIEWIGFDNDSFSASTQSYWSGIADYTTATTNQFTTTGSTLSSAQTILYNLSNKKIKLDETENSKVPAVIFHQENNFYRDGQEYNPNCMGLIDPTHTECIFRVQRNNNDILRFLDAKTKIVTEHYKLAWSAYAIVPEDDDGDGLFDLYLYHNYQPWNGESYRDKNTKKSLLMRNMTVLKFKENGGVIQFKICAKEKIDSKNSVTSCKEKAVIR